MSARKKLALAMMLIAGATGYMAYLGGTASWQYYVTVDECTASAAPPVGARVRVSGRIAPNTLQVDRERREAAFSMAGREGNLAVICQGPLPDKLAEGMDVVVEGRLEDPHLLRGHKLITRCASKYRSQVIQPPTETASRAVPGESR